MLLSTRKTKVSAKTHTHARRTTDKTSMPVLSGLRLTFLKAMDEKESGGAMLLAAYVRYPFLE
jgi:hypothetical protein